MKIDFIRKIAEHRANKIFTPEYFEKATDSWYFDEMDHFESLKCGVKQTKPSKDDVDIYMEELNRLFCKKYDEYFGDDNAKFAYKSCASDVKRLLEQIEKDLKRYSKFNVDSTIIELLSNVEHYFIERFNEFE